MTGFNGRIAHCVVRRSMSDAWTTACLCFTSRGMTRKRFPHGFPKLWEPSNVATGPCGDSRLLRVVLAIPFARQPLPHPLRKGQAIESARDLQSFPAHQSCRRDKGRRVYALPARADHSHYGPLEMSKRRGVPGAVELLQRSDSHMMDDSWTWTATLRRRNDGRFTLSLIQTVTNPPAYRVPGLVGFRRGAALYDFLPGPWHEWTSESLDEEDWARVIDKIATLDAKLAPEVAEAVHADFHPPPAPPPSQVELHARRATWSKEGFGGAGGMAGAKKGALHRRAATIYAQRYLELHGRLPDGTHHVDELVAVAHISGQHRVRADITYPPAPEDGDPLKTSR